MQGGRFKDHVVFITGAASGFGAEAARQFAGQGAQLALSDINRDGVEKVGDSLRQAGTDVFVEKIDISNEDSVKGTINAALSAYGRIDVAINNAGVSHELMALTDLPVAEFDRMMAINARGVFMCMKYQIPHMIERGKGAILNVASAAGLVGAGQLSGYAASKHAVVGLTRAAADEVARKGIRVNALCPAFASTPMFDEMADEIGARHGMDRETSYSRIASRVPMRRVAEAPEIVQAMLWACDPANSFMTGQSLAIDGGLTAV